LDQGRVQVSTSLQSHTEPPMSQCARFGRACDANRGSVIVQCFPWPAAFHRDLGAPVVRASAELGLPELLERQTKVEPRIVQIALQRCNSRNLQQATWGERRIREALEGFEQPLPDTLFAAQRCLLT